MPKKINKDMAIGLATLLIAAGAGGYAIAPDQQTIEVIEVPADCYISIGKDTVDCESAVSFLSQQAQENYNQAQLNSSYMTLIEGRTNQLVEVEKTQELMQEELRKKETEINNDSQRVISNTKTMLDRQLQEVYCLLHEGIFEVGVLGNSCVVDDVIWKWNSEKQLYQRVQTFK